MPQWFRRRALHAVAATATASVLAGCNDSTEPPDTDQRRDRGDPVTDYEATTAREDRVFAPFWLEEDEDEADRPSRPIGDALVTEPPSEGSVSFDPDADAAASIRSFAEDTNFQRECVYLWSTSLSGCHTVKLTAVRRRADEVTLALCRRLRGPDVPFERDSEHTLTLAIRLPFPGDDVHVGSRSLSGGCDGDPEPLTPAGGDGE